MIDLRSDTVTKPTREMLEAMIKAEVGDDVFGEDPTVNALQGYVANLLGKEAALYTPTGLMANQIALKIQTSPGDEVIVESESHIYNYETAAASVLSGVQLRPLKGQYGILTPTQIEKELRLPYYYYPKTTLVCVENTHNKGGGTIYPIETLREIYAVSKKHNMNVHMDGARLWNASAATGIDVKEYARYADTITVCFSKGLGAPVGSALVASKELIEKAKKYRKMFGGGMRQAGVIAAAALYAVQHHRNDLIEDHQKIKYLFNQLSSLHSISIDPNTVQTNILVMEVKANRSVQELVQRLQKRNVLLSVMSPTTIRAVAHRDVSMEQVKEASAIIQQELR